jgi:hypothetical protein
MVHDVKVHVSFHVWTGACHVPMHMLSGLSAIPCAWDHPSAMVKGVLATAGIHRSWIGPVSDIQWRDDGSMHVHLGVWIPSHVGSLPVVALPHAWVPYEHREHPLLLQGLSALIRNTDTFHQAMPPAWTWPWLASLVSFMDGVPAYPHVLRRTLGPYAKPTRAPDNTPHGSGARPLWMTALAGHATSDR